MYQNKIIKAILLLAGNSERFSDTALKQCQLLCGKKVYLHTLDNFLEVPDFDEIILVCNKKCLSEVLQEIAAGSYAIPIKILEGGSTRQESSYLGLMACGEKTDYVVIHDAVRPLISKEIIIQNILKAVESHAVDTCIAASDTLVEVKDEKEIQSIPNRAFFRRGQTPQSFSYPLILKAHQTARQNGVENRTDDCQLVLEMGHPVYYVQGSEENLKITTELDLFLAEQLFRLKKQNPLTLKTGEALAGKKYAIVGGSGGIGKALYEKLGHEGAIPLALSRNASDYSLDIGDHKQVEKIFSELFHTHGEIDGLINSAGLLKMKKVGELTIEEIQEMLNVNLYGVIYSCKAVRVKEGGHIINIASSSYTRGRPHYSIYSCAKAAVVNFTQGFAEEHPQLNVNAIIPHRTKTPLRSANFQEEKDEDLLTPEEVADQIIQLLKCPKISGTIVEIRKKHAKNS